jgi:riboflavin biosynthesis pyrimidine reductase
MADHAALSPLVTLFDKTRGKEIPLGLLRAMADAVVVGSGTVKGDPRHMWTPEAICPTLATDYARLRKALGKREPALKVVASMSGRADLSLPGFAGSEARGRVLVLTTGLGAKRLARHRSASSVEVRVLKGSSRLAPAAAILDEVTRVAQAERVLVEGGPLLVASFYAAGLIDEQFLTLSPQLAGRERGDDRIGFVMGREFAPKDPRWATLADVRRGASHLFLRYLFSRG